MVFLRVIISKIIRKIWKKKCFVVIILNNGHNLWFSVEIGPDGKVTGTGIYVHVHVNCVSNKAMLATILYTCILLYMPVLPEDFYSVYSHASTCFMIKVYPMSLLIRHGNGIEIWFMWSTSRSWSVVNVLFRWNTTKLC